MTDRKWTTSCEKQASLNAFAAVVEAGPAYLRGPGPYLGQRKAPCVVFELVLNRSQLCELREVWKRLQLADDLLQLLLIFYDEELQQTEHLQESHGTE